MIAYLLALLSFLQNAPTQARITHSPALAELVQQSGFSGTILLYDEAENSYLSGDSAAVHVAYTPASTFKIYNSLIGLETGAIAGLEHVFKWSGEARRLKSWEQDLTLRDAFRVSCYPCYRELARMIGEERMRAAIVAMGYGNQDISSGHDHFWLEGSMKISPWEQVQLLRRLVHDELPFSPEVQATVRGMMLLSDQNGVQLHGKTGWAIEGSTNTGWFVGWAQKQGQRMYFATLLRADNPGDSFGGARRTLSEEALRVVGWMD